MKKQKSMAKQKSVAEQKSVSKQKNVAKQKSVAKQENITKQKKSGGLGGLEIAFVILLIVVVIGFLLSGLTYFLLTQSQKIEDSDAKPQKIDTAFKRTDRHEKLRMEFLTENNLENAKYKYSATGQNYYKYFRDPRPINTHAPVNLREFIKANCPSHIYDTSGVFSRYAYDVNGRELSILFDEQTGDFSCSWIYDESTDTYSAP